MKPHAFPYAAAPALAALVFTTHPTAARAQTTAPPAKRITPAAPPKSPGAGPVTGTSDKMMVHVSLTDGSRAVVRTRKDLGFSLSSKPGEAVAFKVDLADLKASLGRLAPEFHQDAVEPRPSIAKGSVTISGGADARSLNVATTAQMIADAVAKDPATTKFTVALDKHPPTQTAERYKGIDGILATFSTRTNANPKRNHNVALAAATIDGTLLAPGATFSVNQTVGQRTQARGFLTAPVFVNAEMVPGIGGGVSQITGTLFNAAARAGLTIVEVYPHSRPVAYLPIGYDATVAFGEEDLKFKNNTSAPVYIDYSFDIKKRHLTATIYGKKTPGQVIRLQAHIDTLAPGRVDAQLYRIIKQNGKVVAKQRLFNHKYRWDPSTKA